MWQYLRRDCDVQPHLKKLCYAQFVKRYESVGKIDEDFDFKPIKINKQFDDTGAAIWQEHIITYDYDDVDPATELPKFIGISDLKPGELPFMRRRSPQVLRYHKFNREKNPHEYFFSELQLYHPHFNSKLFSLEKERKNFWGP